MQNDLDKTKILNAIKIIADVGTKTPPVNASNRQTIRFNRGDAVRLDVSLFQNGETVDISKIASLNIEIFDIGAPNAPEPRTSALLVQKTATATDIKSVSLEEFKSGECNATFILDESDTTIPAGFKWIKISTLSSDAMRTTFSQGWIEVEESYMSSPEAEHENPSIYLTKEKALSIFLSKSDNLADLSDNTQARGNLGVYGMDQVDGMIEAHEHSQYISSAEANSIYAAKTDLEEISENLSDASDQISAVSAENAALSKEIERNGEIVEDKSSVRLKNGWINVKVNGLDSVPMSLCFSYKRKAAWTNTDYFFDRSEAVGLNVNGFNVMCGSNGEDIKFLFRTGTNTGHATSLSFIKENFPTDDKWHSVVMTAAGKMTEQMKCFLDGIQLTPRKGTTFDSTFTGDLSTDSPLRINYYTKSDMSLHSIKIFNFDISGEGSPYTPGDYYNHKKTPPELLNATTGNRALLSLEDDINEVQWKDDSSNGTNAALQDETYVPGSRHTFSVRESATWAVESSSGIFLVKDQPWIPANCRFSVCAKSTSQAQFNIGDDSSSTFFDQTKTVQTQWSEIGSYWNGDTAKRIRLTPISAFKGTVEFFVEIKKLK